MQWASLPRPAAAAPGAPVDPAPNPDPQQPLLFPDPLDFIEEPGDPSARYYHARSSDAELVAGFYSDGRVRLADAHEHRLAGMLQNDRADMLDVANNTWSEMFLRMTPNGEMQLELRGGPYDAQVLTCEAMRR